MRLSSSVGYSYSYVDVEAAARRALRAEIAGYLARARVVRAQASALKGVRRAATGARLARPRAGADSAELTMLASQHREQVEAAERDLAEVVADTWAARLAAPAGRSSRARPSTARVQERVASSSPAPAAPAAELRAAEALMVRELQRCDPADLELLQQRVADLRAATRSDTARRILADLEGAVTDSITRRKRAEHVTGVREALLALAEDALVEDAPRLRAMIEDAPDPGDLTAAVGQAVARADAVRARDAVAQAAAAALGEIGCEVGEDFATLLNSASETVVPFGSGWAHGYGLLIRLPAGEDRLRAAIVRHANAAASPQADELVQRQFCASGLPGWLASLDGQGVRLRPEQRVEPGQLPVPALTADRWPPAAAPARRRPRTAGRPAAARELRREH
jgi:hypothetical protein